MRSLTLVFVVLSLVQFIPETAYAITDTYPWPSAPCMFGAAGGSSCTNPAVNMSSDKYDWYIDENNDGSFSGSTCSGTNSSSECFDNFNYQYRNCTSYVSQKISQVFGVSIPNWGNAEHWESAAITSGYTLDPLSAPQVGDIAQWDGTFGHVAYVYAVTGGIASLAEYNHTGTGTFSSSRTTAINSAGPPDHYIHIGAIESMGGNVGAATYRGNAIVPGSVIYPNQYIASENVQFALVFQSDSNLVLYNAGRAIWQSKTDGQKGTRLVMQTDGNLVMYRSDNTVAWQSRTGGRSGSYAIVQPDGNFVVRDANAAYWWSSTGGHANLDYFGSDRLLAGQKLLKNQYLRSSDNRYALLLQSDGNLVLYGPGYHALWQSKSSAGDRLIMQTDGNLVLYAASIPKWWNGGSGANSYLILQNDGNLVEYSSRNTPIWFTATGGLI